MPAVSKNPSEAGGVYGSGDGIGRYLFGAWLVVGGLICLHPAVSPAVGLIGGMAVALLVNRAAPKKTKKQAKRLLQLGVIGLGFSLHLGDVWRVGGASLLIAALTIGGTFLLAQLVAQMIGVGRNVATLIAAGTAICGGSAIAAVGAAIRAKEAPMAIALCTVFTLNALSLILFPAVGQALSLSPEIYGQWVGFAIHDVSSVVGAADFMGPEALQTATTVKLARTLWIIPVTIGIVAIRRWLWPCHDDMDEDTPCDGRGGFRGLAQRWRTAPWFILGFLVASAMTTASPAIYEFAPAAVLVAKALLTASLFYIGAGISRADFARSGLRPIALGVFLWIAVSVSSFAWLH